MVNKIFDLGFWGRKDLKLEVEQLSWSENGPSEQKIRKIGGKNKGKSGETHGKTLGGGSGEQITENTWKNAIGKNDDEIL